MKTKKTPTLYATIAEYVKEQIASQKLKPGEKVYEEELQKKFNVSHITTKKALSLLVEQGLITRVPGRGTFVQEGELSGAAGSSRPAAEAGRSSAAGDASHASHASHTGRVGSTDPVGVAGAITNPADPVKTFVFLLPLTEKNENVFTKTHHIPEILIGVEQACKQRGYKLIIQDTENEQPVENVLISRFKQEPLQGMIIYPTCHEFFSDEIMRLKLDGYPFVIVDQFWPQLDAYYVHSDHRAGSYRATKHLIEAGHTEIGLIFDMDWNSTNTRNRIDGYEHCLSEHGLPIRKDYLFDSTGRTSRLPLEIEGEVLQDMMDFITANSQITAYLCSSMLLLKALRALGLKLGKDISAIFIDDSFIASYYDPPLSVIRQQNRDIGCKAVEMLDNWGHYATKTVQLDTELILRESVGPPPARP